MAEEAAPYDVVVGAVELEQERFTRRQGVEGPTPLVFQKFTSSGRSSDK